jgi:hypothetical protein
MKQQKDEKMVYWRCPKCLTEEFVPKEIDKYLTEMLCPSQKCNFKTKMERIQ